MSESVQPLPPETGEALSLYVLDLLPADERVALESQLAADPALRRELRELQGTLDGWIQSMPARPAPLHVWGRIAATVRSAEAPVFATSHPTMERRGWTWGWQALGAAACLAAGMALHAWWSGPSRVRAPESSPLASDFYPAAGGTAARQPHLATDTAATGARPGESPGAPSDRTPRSLGGRDSAGGILSPVAHDDVLPNPTQPKERALQTQVAVLTELLNRELGTPPGTSRLQIVRLVGAGETAETVANTAIQPDTLAALALTLLNPAPTPSQSQALSATTSTSKSSTTGTTTTGNPTGNVATSTSTSTGTPATGNSGATSPGEVSDTTSRTVAAATSTPVIQVQLSSADTPATSTTGRDATSPQVKATGTTLGSLAPAVADRTSLAVTPTPIPVAATSPTGILLMLPHESAGTALISNPSPLAANEVYQFWQTDPSTGTAVNLGTAHSDAPTAIFNFTLTQGRSSSAVFVTREPTGGSTTPTGPVVVSTPAPKP